MIQLEFVPPLNKRQVRIHLSIYRSGRFLLKQVNAGLAQGKNRSGLNWFLLSLLLGPVATFFIVIAGKK